MDIGARYHLGMVDDVPAILQEIMELTGDKQARLAKRIGVSQSTINRWINREAKPNIEDWDRVKRIWYDLSGVKMTLDDKVKPYGPRTEAAIHAIVDDYLSRLPGHKR